MKNIRLYIDGQRADLDSTITLPFNYQTTDAENPTAVKNSFSKTITLQGTETNRRLFGGLWHLDSIVQDPRPAPPPEYIATDTESDAEFIKRSSPGLATGDRAKVTKVYGDTVVWNQLGKGFVAGNWSNEGGVTSSFSDGVASITSNNANYGIYFVFSYQNTHKYYVALSGRSASAITVRCGASSKGVYTDLSVPAGNTWARASKISTCTSSGNVAFYIYAQSANASFDVKDLVVVDLTQMFGSTIANSMTAADFEALYSLNYYDYNAGELKNNAASAISFRDAGNSEVGSFPLNVTDLVPSNKPTVALNQHIKEATWSSTSSAVTLSNTGTDTWTLNGTATANGNFYMSSATLCDPLIPAGHKAYYRLIITGGSFTGTIRFGASSGGNQNLTSKGMSIIATYSGGNTYPVLSFLSGASASSLKFHIMCIDLTDAYGAGNEPFNSGELDELISEYIPYNTAGTPIANRIFPVGLKGIASVSDEAGTNAVRKIGVVNLGTLSWTYYSASKFFYTDILSVLKIPANTSTVANLRCSLYQAVANSTLEGDATLDMVMSVNPNPRIRIRNLAYTTAADFKAAMAGVYLYYERATPETYTLAQGLSDTPVPSSPSGYQVRIPEDTASSVLAPFRGDLEYGYMKVYPADDGVYFNPMKRVPFLLYVDEMVVERGYCQLLAINRKSRDYTFSVSLYGGLGEFFYNLQTDSDGEPKRLADLDWGADLGFTINKTTVQNNWDDLLGGTLPTIAFVPMHNGVPDTIDGNKMLISGGGVPSSITDGGDTYSTKSGYLLANLNRKYTEWEVGDLRSYLQRPALRLKDFIDAVCNPTNNGGWTVDLDTDFFTATNPYYEKSYILLPQLNVEESTDNICDDGKVTPTSDYPSTVTRTTSLELTSGGCMTIVSDQVDMSSTASNAYLKLSIPVQLAVTGLTNQGDLYMTNRVSHHTQNKTICMMVAAWDDDGNLLAVSNRYVFTSKSHRMETGDVVKPAAPYPTSDAQIDGYFKWDGGEYVFRSDDNPANTFALVIDKIPRPSSTLKYVRLDFYLQMTTAGIPTLNKKRKGENSSNVYVNNNQFSARILSGSNNTLSLIEPTQYATDSHVTQEALLSSLKVTPLDLLLSITKRFGLMWVQDNRDKKVSLYMRKNYFTGKVSDIHNRIDYSKGLKASPVSAESNNYMLEDKYPETTLSKAYESDWERVYGSVRLKTGYDFGKDKVELFDKSKLNGYIDGALSGSGYWQYSNTGGKLPSAIADGMKVTYYLDVGGETKTKDVEYNLFNVGSISKTNSPALGVASMNDGGEEEAVEVEPALVFFAGGQVPGTWYLTDDIAAMANLNNGPCWIFDPSLLTARVPKFARVATFSGETYSLDYGTPRETYYIPEVSLAPEQAIYARFWEGYLTDLLSRDTKKVECYVVFPPHLDMRQEMRKFYLFDRSLWVLNKITDYDPTKETSVKCEFIRVINKEAYRG